MAYFIHLVYLFNIYTHVCMCVYISIYGAIAFTAFSFMPKIIRILIKDHLDNFKGDFLNI